ncbi:MAG: GNAT family N-acetyltransferase [Verrucomicrobiia bacterium]|jgi:ribosomal protein S18 acetylase RimI-like enzyme
MKSSQSADAPKLALTAAAQAGFRSRLARMLGGQRPDARTRFEAGCVAVQHHQPFVQGKALIAMFQNLAWEETIFHCPCWQLHLGLAPQDTTGIQFVTCAIHQRGIIWTRVASEHAVAIGALCCAGFEPILEMINLDRPLTQRRLSPPPTKIEIRQARKRDADAVAEIARRMFSKDRFHADPRIAPRFADQAHQEWARNSVLGKVADQTLVAVDADRIAGFHALKWLQTPRGRVGLTVLIGIAEAYRGRGVGKALLGAGLLTLQEGGAKQAWVRTEAENSTATRLYESFGFRPQTQFWYLRKFNL